MRFHLVTLFSFSVMLALQASEIPLGGIGYRYDGSGVYANCKPPITADPATGKGVRWKVPTVNWGWSQPVEIDEQVLVLCEPGAEGVIWPTLVSCNRKTGTELWRTVIDPLLAHDLPKSERESLTEKWALVNEFWRFAYTAAAKFPGSSAKEQDVIRATLAERQCDMGRYRPGYGLLRKLKINHPDYKDAVSALKPYGPRVLTWQSFGMARVGAAFATPVTDGKSILVQTLWGTVAGLDMDGNIRWIKDTGARMTGGMGASPRIVNGIGLSCQNGLVVAWDMMAGKEKWRVGEEEKQKKAGHGYIGSGVVMDIDGTVVFVDQTHRVVRVDDGKVLVDRLGDPKYSSVLYDDKSDRIFINFGKGEKSTDFLCYQLKAVDGGVVAEEVWRIQPGLGGLTGVFCQGEIFQNGAVFSAETGWIKRGIPWQEKNKKPEDRVPVPKRRGGASSKTKNLSLAANGMIFGLKDQKGAHNMKEMKLQKDPYVSTLEIYSVDSKKLSSIDVPMPAKEDPHGFKVWEQGIFNERHNVNNVVDYGYAFSVGRDCIYVRNPGYIYCLGE